MLDEIDQQLLADFSDLTPKQLEVLDLVVDRRTNKEIAAALEISPSAVEQRLQSVRRKFGARSRAELARAYQHARDTCQISTGAKFQVEQRLEDVEYRASQDGGGVVVVQSDPAGLTHPRRRLDDQVRFLDRLDSSVGVIGRIAVVTTISATLALLFIIISGISKI